MTLRRALTLTYAVLAICGIAACGPAEDPPGEAGVAPGSDGPHQPSGPADATPPVQWVEFRHAFNANPTFGCDAPFQFNVGREGGYQAGPCTQGGLDTKYGNLTPEELKPIQDLAQAITAADPSKPAECETTLVLLPSKLELAFEPSAVFTLYDAQTGLKRCYKGGKANVDAALRTLTVLEAKYYPHKALPSPTPTPTPSMNPSPTP